MTNTQYLQVILNNPWLSLLTAIVAFPVIKGTINFAWLELRTSSLPRYRHGGPSTWALVTGASDGIGFGFASELAARGFNIILHGRNANKISGKIKDLELKYPTRSFKALIVDAADRTTWHSLDDFVQMVQGDHLKLTVLINNVGTGTTKSGFAFMSVEEQEFEDVNSIIDTNTVFPVQITRLLLPVLKENQPSLIINNGSGAGTLGVPYLTTYSATKAFNFIWSRSLRREMIVNKQDIEVFSIQTGIVQSAGSRMRPLTWYIPSSAAFAKSTLQRVGCGYDMVSGCWAHALQSLSLDLIPSFMMDRVSLTAALGAMEWDRKAA